MTMEICTVCGWDLPDETDLCDECLETCASSCPHVVDVVCDECAARVSEQKAQARF